MRREIQLVGHGGQGVRLAGSILSRACGIYDKKNIAETHLYGAAARGELSESELIISDGEIYYVKVESPDVLLALTQDAYDDFRGSVRDDGLIIADDFYVEEYDASDKKLRLFPLTRVALDVVGALIAVNVVALGVISVLDPLITPESVRLAIKDKIKKAYLDKNLKAFERGLKLGEGKEEFSAG
ncbi:2-oxoacid:acceptor oxidoreductase family protein [candidate division WOR-3 bacterium]|nr:2-oxoacid:acceptor oxidoreductase family protein [candidate division WOR-3 bacterium]